MASDTSSVVSTPDGRPPMTAAEVIAYVRTELDIDDEHLAHLTRAITSNVDLPRDAHSGVTLDLSHKNIRELPVDVVALIKDRVERLALSHNPQIAIPTQIVQCDRLRYLNLRWNSLKYFPEAILQLSKLEILDISKNKIVAIPEDIKRMSSLKFLAVARNRITRLPLSLGEMASLSKLKFDENPIEFPPADVLRPQPDRFLNTIEAEKEKDVCQQVKRFLRQNGLRQRLMNRSEEDTSESNVETPRPPRRTIGGRFPVRPSISGIENIADLKTGSPDNAPPIPMRSHARESSQNLSTQLSRPGIAPLHTDGSDVSRSRSETVSSSASLRFRRQGFVPSKRTVSNNHDLNPVNEAGDPHSTRSSQVTIRPSHSRDPSIASTYTGYNAASSSGETSSDAMSPVANNIVRYQSSRRPPTAVQAGHDNVARNAPLIAGRRLLFILSELQRALSRASNGLKSGTPQRVMLERQLFSANAQNSELERLLNRIDDGQESTPRREVAATRNMILAAVGSMKAYGVAAKTFRGSLQKLVEGLDRLQTRSLVFHIYSTITEARNVVKLLGFEPVPMTSKTKSTPRASKTWSNKTVTPTQTKPAANKRLRGATILRSTSSNATLRAAPPPVPLNGSASRTNTMTSSTPMMTPSAPRSGDSFSSAHSSALPSRSNTLRSVQAAEDSDEAEQFERIFLKLKHACHAATNALPHCHAEFTVHKDNADSAGKIRAAHSWSRALSKCNAVIRANQALNARLKVIKLKDPGVSNSDTDFWYLCGNFVQSWADFAMEVKELDQQRIEITAIKTVMKPVQRALKDVSRTISDSPLYHQALRASSGGPPSISMSPSNQHGLAPPFPAGLNIALAQSLANQRDGPATSVPATPLAAALGPAAQATLGHHGSITPSGSQPPMDYFPVGPAQSGGGTRDLRIPSDSSAYGVQQYQPQQTHSRDQQYLSPQQQYQHPPPPHMQHPSMPSIQRRETTSRRGSQCVNFSRTHLPAVPRMSVDDELNATRDREQEQEHGSQDGETPTQATFSAQEQARKMKRK